MLKLFSLIETRQIQAKILQGFRVFAIFAFPSLVRSMRFKAAIADNFILCLNSYGLCVADVVYSSSPHQRCGKSGKGDSGKRNEVDLK